MIIPFNQVYLELDTSLVPNNQPIPGNRFRSKPIGIVIEDTVNNLALPIPLPVVDSDKFNLPMIYKQYSLLHSGDSSLSVMPWHYIIEYLNRDYIIYNTRPLDLTYPYTTQEVIELSKDRIKLNDFTRQILADGTPELKNMIHVLIIGDSTRDVYTKQLYRKLVDFIIGPISRINLFPATILTNIIPLNLGPRFLNNILNNAIR